MSSMSGAFVQVLGNLILIHVQVHWPRLSARDVLAARGFCSDWQHVAAARAGVLQRAPPAPDHVQ